MKIEYSDKNTQHSISNTQLSRTVYVRSTLASKIGDLRAFEYPSPKSVLNELFIINGYGKACIDSTLKAARYT